ncbi:protein amalgam-like, partial [Stylophora pistillata]|uniref:protein amalgam-like n=1 Tax=Stylophora pistillata TaxID=50429 RepID=UPI000C039FD6
MLKPETKLSIMFENRVIFGCCVLFVALHSFAAGFSFISRYAGRNVTASVGSPLNFSWAFKADSFLSIDFGYFTSLNALAVEDKNRLVQIFPDGTVTPKRGRFTGTWDKQKNPGQVTFTLNSVQVNDGRLFGCSIMPSLLSLAIIGDAVNLVVYEKPKIDNPSVGISYNEGLSVNITCTARGKPAPNVKWLRKGAMLSSATKTASLTFANISRSDDGNYTCEACNSEGCEDIHIVLVINYPPKIQNATASSLTSWIGQTVTLKCQSDGVPTPTLAWYKPDGNEIFRVTNKESTIQVLLKDSGDFGDYKCAASNGLVPPDDKIVKMNQIKKPSQASIISTERDIRVSSLTVRWTAPADDGGSLITAYRVIILKGDTEKGSVNITDPVSTSYTFGNLDRYTNYTVKVFARNFVFEGDAAVRTLKTKSEGPPYIVKINDLPNLTTADTITLTWEEPGNNGKVITQYTAYQRTVTDTNVGDWNEIGKITNIKDRQLEVKLKKGEVYEFA